MSASQKALARPARFCADHFQSYHSCGKAPCKGSSDDDITRFFRCAGEAQHALPARPQPVAQRDRSAVGLNDGAGDREAQTGAAGLAAARGLEPREGLEHGLELVVRQAGTAVGDGDDRSTRVLGQRYGRRPAIATALSIRLRNARRSAGARPVIVTGGDGASVTRSPPASSANSASSAARSMSVAVPPAPHCGQSPASPRPSPASQ